MLRANSHTTDDWTVPSFCESCGQPYPWTQSKIEAAKEILELQTALTAQEKADFNADMNDIVRDVPRTRAAALRIKSLITKLPGAAGSVLRDLFVEVASETAKKIITGS